MSNYQNRIFVILLNWNGLNDTLECITSLKKVNYTNFETVMVDNGSTDGSVKVIRARHPEITVIETGENLGFAEGNNVGIRHAIAQGADYVWLLNNDTTVDPDALGALVRVAEMDDSFGIIGSKIYYYDDPEILWFAGGPMNWERFETPHIGINERDVGQYDQILEYDRVTGCSMLVSRAVCEQAGLMDHAYFLYVEEVDWCLRAGRVGFKVMYAPDSKVYHKVSKSIQLIGSRNRIFSYYKVRNFLYLINKKFVFPMSIWMTLRFVSKVLRGKRRQEHDLKPILFGLYDFFTGRMGKLTRKL